MMSFTGKQAALRLEQETALQEFYTKVRNEVQDACDLTVSTFLSDMQITSDHEMSFMEKAALR